jgi:hypothetical protein
MAALERANWEAFTEMFGALAFKRAGGDIGRRYAALIREAITPEGFADQWFKFYIRPGEFEESMGDRSSATPGPAPPASRSQRRTASGACRRRPGRAPS